MRRSATAFMHGASFAVPILIAATPAQAEDYPTRPITAIIPFAGGSASDVVSRILFDRMSRSLGQPIAVETEPAAPQGPPRRVAPPGRRLRPGGRQCDALQEARLRP